jgi:hypothetical protein
VYQTISRGFVNLLNAKKIQDTKFPFPYAQVIAFLILTTTILMPLQISSMIQSKVWCAIISFMPVWGAYCLNFIAQELENPFGTDKNDLPLEHFQIEMNNCLMMLLHPNTDLIPALNPKCEKDFHRLRAGYRMSHKPEHNADGTLTRKKTRRLSDFGVNRYDEEEESQTRHQSLFSAGARSSQSSTTPFAIGSSPGENSKEVRSPTVTFGDEVEPKKDGKVEAKKEEKLDTSKAVALVGIEITVGDEPVEAERNKSRSEQPLMAQMKSNDEQTIAGQTPILQIESLQPLLAKSTNDLVRTLQGWTENIERQIDDLNTNSVELRGALRKFGQSFPMISESPMPLSEGDPTKKGAQSSI